MVQRSNNPANGEVKKASPLRCELAAATINAQKNGYHAEFDTLIRSQTLWANN